PPNAHEHASAAAPPLRNCGPHEDNPETNSCRPRASLGCRQIAAASKTCPADAADTLAAPAPIPSALCSQQEGLHRRTVPGCFTHETRAAAMKTGRPARMDL